MAEMNVDMNSQSYNSQSYNSQSYNSQSYNSIDKELDDVLEFGDVLSSLNIKQLTTLKEALHLDTMSQKRYLRKAYPETDRDGGMLLNAYSACSLVKDPNDYINYELDKRLDKLLNPQIDKAHNNYYTFMYCYLHNSGFIIHGKHERLPNNYTMLPDYNCGCGSWYFKDIFMRINKGEIEHIENILENSSRVWGGHSFLIYMDKLTDEIGNKLNMSDHPELQIWLTSIDCQPELSNWLTGIYPSEINLDEYYKV